ncbi:hypothetical protein COU57_03900 [Candidatus Pacearchaeota archaeon CG10_big_fil_rev_8_21_14_0_10_32_14]|nr:MAG: hypothetical protein COU57_03900 [Candidatus Pacearchaeota archaeon CG10_big_fil_rev_8_21_14_0_10_32_14]
MVFIKDVVASVILDSRKEKTIQITVITTAGKFTSSAPQGKSTGKFEVKTYKKSIEEDIKSLKKMMEYLGEDDFTEFDDLKKVEDILAGHTGSNTVIAFEYSLLKAIAKENGKEVWEIIYPDSDKSKMKFPRLVGNCIGGGKHTRGLGERELKPEFQEFLLIPDSENVLSSWNVNKTARANANVILGKVDGLFKSKPNDENAWQTSLDNKRVLEIVDDIKEEVMDEFSIKLDCGLDVAASSFYSRKKYRYGNPKFDRTIEEQIDYLSNLIKNFRIFYIEDPFDEEDFESFAVLQKKFPKAMIVGDDLTVTNSKRLEKAIKMKSITGIIVKPNQCGSLIEVKRVCELAKKNNIKIIFSHRSGETTENILADLAFGFGADFLKCSIVGKEREAKIERLIEISKKLN